MQAYSELIPPTAVTHAVSLAFIGPKSINLILAKTSLLQIFRTQTINSKLDADAPHAHSTKLVLIAEYTLAGTVTSLAKVKIADTKSGGEALLVATRDAKLSLIEWDPEAHSISTLSIHYYEGEDIKAAPWASDISEFTSYLTVDPRYRCAALKFGQKHLAFLPFRQSGDDLATGDDDPDDEALRRTTSSAPVNGDSQQKLTPYKSSFVLPLTVLDPSLIFPVDLAFLYEYREPTLGILSSAKARSAGLDAKRRDLLNYSAITLDLEQRARTPLLSVKNLPNDLFKVLPLPLPIGGVLLIGGNEIIHVDQAGKCNGIAVNDFAKTSSAFPLTDRSELGLKLEGCTIEHIPMRSTDMLVIFRTGGSAIITFDMDGRTVSSLAIRRLPPSKGGALVQTSASCTALLDQDLMFVGSSEGKSLLLQCEQEIPTMSRKRSHAEMLGKNGDNSHQDSDEEDFDDDDDDDIYGNGTNDVKDTNISTSDARNAMPYSFIAHDELPSLAPMKDITVAKSIMANGKSVTGGNATQENSLELAIPVGRGNAGAIAFVTRDIRPANIKHYDNLKTAQGVWSVQVKKSEEHDAEQDHTAEYDDFVVISELSADGGSETSRIYVVNEDKFEEVEDCDFERDISTTNLGTLASGTRIVQVSKSELRCYDQGGSEEDGFFLIQLTLHRRSWPVADLPHDRRSHRCRAQDSGLGFCGSISFHSSGQFQCGCSEDRRQRRRGRTRVWREYLGEEMAVWLHLQIERCRRSTLAISP